MRGARAYHLPLPSTARLFRATATRFSFHVKARIFSIFHYTLPLFIKEEGENDCAN